MKVEILRHHAKDAAAPGVNNMYLKGQVVDLPDKEARWKIDKGLVRKTNSPVTVFNRRPSISRI